jgi:hypothetical protein
VNLKLNPLNPDMTNGVLSINKNVVKLTLESISRILQGGEDFLFYFFVLLLNKIFTNFVGCV